MGVGNVTTYGYDSVFGNPDTVTEAGRAATTFGYDALFQTSMRDGKGNVTQVAYDALGRPTSRTDASSVTETFRYDISGRQTSWTNRRGQRMTYTYDSNSRLTSRTGTGISDSYSYTTAGNITIAVAQNAVEVDSMFSVSSISGSMANLDSTVIHLNGVRYRVLHGRPGSLATPDSMTVTTSSGVSFRTRRTTLNATTGLVTSINDGFNSATPRYTTEALPDSLYNSVSGWITTPYTSLHQAIGNTFTNATLQTAFARSVHFDTLGRVDQLNFVSATARQVYGYDLYGDLASVQRWTGCGGAVSDPNAGNHYTHCSALQSTTTYTYDAVGNRTDLSATYYTGNRLANVDGGFFTYDADGNVHQKYGLASNPHNQFFYWNPESRLDSVTYDGYITTRYEYNALGQPVKKYVNGTLTSVYLWDGTNLLTELDATNRRLADYQYAGTDVPYAYTTGWYSPTVIGYPELDPLGNVIGAHEGTTVSQSASYDAWGTPTVTGTAPSRLAWKGLLWEGPGVNLYYMRGRWYDPQVGRFLQEDPIHSGVNDYSFAGNDPVNGNDPTGLSECIPTSGAGFLYGGSLPDMNVCGTDPFNEDTPFDLLIQQLGGNDAWLNGILYAGATTPHGHKPHPKPKPTETPKWRSARCILSGLALAGATVETITFGIEVAPALAAADGLLSAGSVFLSSLAESMVKPHRVYLKGLDRGVVNGTATVSRTMLDRMGKGMEGAFVAHGLGERYNGWSFLADITPGVNIFATGKSFKEHCF